MLIGPDLIGCDLLMLLVWFIKVFAELIRLGDAYKKTNVLHNVIILCNGPNFFSFSGLLDQWANNTVIMSKFTSLPLPSSLLQQQPFRWFVRFALKSLPKTLTPEKVRATNK